MIWMSLVDRAPRAGRTRSRREPDAPVSPDAELGGDGAGDSASTRSGVGAGGYILYQRNQILRIHDLSTAVASNLTFPTSFASCQSVHCTGVAHTPSRASPRTAFGPNPTGASRRVTYDRSSFPHLRQWCTDETQDSPSDDLEPLRSQHSLVGLRSASDLFALFCSVLTPHGPKQVDRQRGQCCCLDRFGR
nr:hypothetical protein CFP56_52531 [Quercus suber]